MSEATTVTAFTLAAADAAGSLTSSGPAGCDCGCCAGVGGRTPLEITNRPGLSSIAFRVGTYGDFRDSMIAALSAAQRPALKSLTTRATDDYALALIDAFAVVLDVLTFYQERLASEVYLRTALQRFSVRELARLVGFELAPGVAASVDLAFTLDTAPGAPQRVTIPAGLKVQSVPGPQETPQTFETAQAVIASPQWNAMRPQLTRRHPLLVDNSNELREQFYFEGLTTGLKQGDVVVLASDKYDPPLQTLDPTACLVASVVPEPAAKRTSVRLKKLPGLARRNLIDLAGSDVSPISSFVSNAFHSYRSLDTLRAKAALEKITLQSILDNIRISMPAPPRAMAFRTRASVFGHNAPYYFALSPEVRSRIPTEVANQDTGSPWNAAQVNAFPASQGAADVVYLDNTYPSVVEDSYVLLQTRAGCSLRRVNGASEVSVTAFTISAKCTRLELDEDVENSFQINNTTVHGQSVSLNLARLPREDDVTGAQIELEGVSDGIYAGQTFIVCGERRAMQGSIACERVTVRSVEINNDDGGTMRVHFDGPGLTNAYLRPTVTVYGNVAGGTHGETVQREVLGSGNAAVANQTFVLKSAPLTYVSGDDASGAVSTLEVRVNDVRWHEAKSLYGRGPDERIFVTQRDEQQHTTIVFGDGVNGARLPSGVENVTAIYRKGIGTGGLVRPGQISQLLTRPLGLKEVTNPMPAAGAQDPQSLDDARAQAPVTTLTLDRVVSLRDYEDFALNFAGIAKAMAGWSWGGRGRGVVVTVAGPDGRTIPAGSPLFQGLIAALRDAGDPRVRFEVRSYESRYFRVGGTVWIDSDRLAATVAAAIESALRERFSFAARDFGQGVARSEVIAVIQQVDGVVGVDLDAFYRWDEPGPSLRDSIAAAPATTQGEKKGAELLMLDDSPLTDLRVTPLNP